MSLSRDTRSFLSDLGLVEYYPGKISLQKVMEITTAEPTSDFTLKAVPWIILKKLIMIDFHGRDSAWDKSTLKTDIDTDFDADVFLDSLDSDSSSTKRNPLDVLDSDSSSTKPNPLDVFLAAFSCCDHMLRQILVQKMFMCRLAVPFIIPTLSGDRLQLCQWALRTIVVECCIDKQPVEMPIIDSKFNIVSFVRIRRPWLSKSKLMNNVMSDEGHHTFFSMECSLGTVGRKLANGTIETSWILPSGKDADSFKDVTVLLNLRGNAEDFKRQSQLIGKISSFVVVIVDFECLNDESTIRMVRYFYDGGAIVTLILTSEVQDAYRLKEAVRKYNRKLGEESKKTKYINGEKQGSITTFRDKVRKAVSKSFVGQNRKSVEEVGRIVASEGVAIDEGYPLCQEGKESAQKVMQCMKGKSMGECKQMIPLQGREWQEWSKLQRDRNRMGGSWKKRRETKSESNQQIESKQQIEIEKAELGMKKIRKQQLENVKTLSPLMSAFINKLNDVSGDSQKVQFFLEWMKIFLDSRSRSAKDLRHLAFGLEHLFREVGQIYEVAMTARSDFEKESLDLMDNLPKVAAKLLLLGYPLELMDGDASNVPLTWIKAVLGEVREEIGDKKLFILSVLGIQSSGKSTLLNAMFGLRFAVSAGRCTRGVFIQVVKVNREANKLPYDYILVVDTEGLRSPELANEKHDNEMATFVIGLGDVTILNIKGENVAEIQNILQISVHAFLRMKIVNKKINLHQECIFIHQNVPAIDAKVKMVYGRKILEDNLDKMAKEAAVSENRADVDKFKDVIDFDSENHVWYFSDLWNGDPPMATVNPGYSEKVQEVKNILLSKARTTFLTVSDLVLRIDSLWNAVLSDDFVFSFRNCLATKAYCSLEQEYFRLTWQLEKSVTEWLTDATNPLYICTLEKLDTTRSALLKDLEKKIGERQVEVQQELDDFFKNSNLKDILIQWKSEKTSSLKSAANKIANTTKEEIRKRTETQRLKLMQEGGEEECEQEIMRRAKDLAEELKGKVSDSELNNLFDEMWISWENELFPRTATTEVKICDAVEDILMERLNAHRPILNNELYTNPLYTQGVPREQIKGSLTVDYITNDHISIPRGLLESSTTIWKEKDRYRFLALNVTDTILEEIDVQFKDICSRDTDFQPVFATNIINIVLKGIEDHNVLEKKLFTFLPTYKVKLAVYVCKHAVSKFQMMREDYDKKHGAATILEGYRKAAWNLFKNVVEERSGEVVAVDLFCYRLEGLIEKKVREKLPIKIVDDIRTIYSTKYYLMLDILDDLADKGIFENYKSYLGRPCTFVLKWLTKKTNRHVFTKMGQQSKYAMHAREVINELISCLNESITTATKDVKGLEGSRTARWVECFRKSASSKLVIPDADMKLFSDQKVSNWTNFEGLLLECLEKLEKLLIERFNNETKKDVKWEGATPYQQLVDTLWGCRELCPFCKTPCQMTEPNHTEAHRCIQHRPAGIGGITWLKDNTLTIDTCNYYVQSTRTFSCGPWCHHSGCSTTVDHSIRHYYLDYKSFIPNWDIAPNDSSDCSEYWKWFMRTYKHQLKDMHAAELSIPESWNSIDVHLAKDSLRKFRG